MSLHIPLTPETRHFISEPELRMMKSTAILINLARGPVVDPKALYTALSEKWIQAAALDVTDPEPIPPDDPLLTLFTTSGYALGDGALPQVIHRFPAQIAVTAL